MNNDTHNQSFYIGWQAEMPDLYKKKVRHFIYAILSLILLVSALLVLFQKPFAKGVFELGALTALEGTLFMTPVPMLKIQDDESDQLKSILLIGFGKMGAENAFKEHISRDLQLADLNGSKARLEGTLIYDQEKTLLELTNGEASILKLGAGTNYEIKEESLGFQTLQGEIYDPKCAFGVMKPGYGKIHRSCAVRCISGGIPPVLKIENESGEKNYVLVVDTMGNPINKAILPYVADQIQICGQLERQDDWLVLYTNPTEQLARLHPYWMKGDLAMCAE